MRDNILLGQCTPMIGDNILSGKCTPVMGDNILSGKCTVFFGLLYIVNTLKRNECCVLQYTCTLICRCITFGLKTGTEQLTVWLALFTSIIIFL